MERVSLLKNVGLWGTPLNTTDDDGMNPVPLIVSVRGEAPAGDETGESPVIDGCGFGAGGNG